MYVPSLGGVKSVRMDLAILTQQQLPEAFSDIKLNVSQFATQACCHFKFTKVVVAPWKPPALVKKCKLDMYKV